MERLKTELEVLGADDVKHFIELHEKRDVPRFDKLWRYYNGDNPAIMDKRMPDPNNPDNRTPVPYVKKIITTYTGYAYRPRYITYKSDNEPFMAELQENFNENNEHIKTSLNGRNSGLFGVSYELLYLDSGKITGKTQAHFQPMNPREIILIYNFDIEPKKKFGIRYFRVREEGQEETWDVYLYSDKAVDKYEMRRDKWQNIKSVTFVSSEINPFKQVPIIAYYFSDNAVGLIDPVIPLIDDYDLLISDSINEFDRFAHAYLKLVGMSLSPPQNSKEPGAISRALQLIKRRRVFEMLRDKDDVSFLTKDIPTDYIKFMAELIREQIHNQSHVPDLSSASFKDGLSGVAVQRLMFDFENVVASSEAGFDLGLGERIEMISEIFKMTGRPYGSFDEITISHKRNAPLNIKEFAETAELMKSSGFSRYLIADIMPDDIIPNVEAELERQDEESREMFPDVEAE